MDELIKRLRETAISADSGNEISESLYSDILQAADAIVELQTTLCNWCAVCSEDKRDLSTCEIYESCRAKTPKEE